MEHKSLADKRHTFSNTPFPKGGQAQGLPLQRHAGLIACAGIFSGKIKPLLRKAFCPPYGGHAGAARLKMEQSYKPDSVFARGANDGHLSGTSVTRRLERLTRFPPALSPAREEARPWNLFSLSSGGVYQAITSPRRRCALTAPFQPYLCPRGPSAVYFLLHFPYPWSAYDGFRTVAVSHHLCLL